MKKITIFLLLTILVLFCQVESFASYYGSRNSNIYHYTSCEWARQIYPQNLIVFDTVSSAKRSGYRACYVCRPPQYDVYITGLQIDSPTTLQVGESEDKTPATEKEYNRDLGNVTIEVLKDTITNKSVEILITDNNQDHYGWG